MPGYPFDPRQLVEFICLSVTVGFVAGFVLMLTLAAFNSRRARREIHASVWKRETRYIPLK